MAINRHHAFVAVCLRILKLSRSVEQQGEKQVGAYAPECKR